MQESREGLSINCFLKCLGVLLEPFFCLVLASSKQYKPSKPKNIKTKNKFIVYAISA